MLYPKEDRLNNTLMFACRTCQFSEPASSSCVYRNNLYNTVGETAGVTQDVGSDPTVGTTDLSARAQVIPLSLSKSGGTCGDAVLESDDFFICTLCGDEVGCDFCGEKQYDESLENTRGEYEDDAKGLSGEEEDYSTQRDWSRGG